MLEVTWKVNARLGIYNLFTFHQHNHTTATLPHSPLPIAGPVSCFIFKTMRTLRIRHVLHDQINNKPCQTQPQTQAYSHKAKCLALVASPSLKANWIETICCCTWICISAPISIYVWKIYSASDRLGGHTYIHTYIHPVGALCVRWQISSDWIPGHHSRVLIFA